jgi:hypothetical protein
MIRSRGSLPEKKCVLDVCERMPKGRKTKELITFLFRFLFFLEKGIFFVYD